MAVGPAGSVRWTDEFLDSMRQVTDPLADDLVRVLFEQGDVTAVNRLMDHLLENVRVIPEDLPPSVRRYLDVSGTLPEWADPGKISRAEDFFGRYGLPICLSLMCGSLPQAYAGAKGVQVLYLTARLRTDPKRRIGETAQMIINSLSPGGLAPNGPGLQDVQRVRLMHAAIRQLILRSGKWNPDWDQPINQEDLAGTLMTFTVTILDSLERLEVKVDPLDAESYLHAWKVIGHVLGLRDEVLPEDLEDARALMREIGRRQFASSQAGSEMARALIEMMEEQTPGELFKGMPATMIRHLLGDHVSDMISVPAADWTDRLIGRFGTVFDLAEEAEGKSSVLARAGEHFTRSFLEGIAWVDRGGRRASFSIPTTLQQQWRMKSHPGEAVAREIVRDAKGALHKILSQGHDRLFLSLLAISAILVIPLIVLVLPLTNSTAVLGIVSFELAGSAHEAQAILDSWDATSGLRAALAIGYDPLFLIVYSAMAAIGCMRAAALMRARGWLLAGAGVALAWGQCLATGLAIVQDGAMAAMLLGGVSESLRTVTYWSAAPKYLLYGMGLIYILLGEVARFVSRPRTF